MQKYHILALLRPDALKTPPRRLLGITLGSFWRPLVVLRLLLESPGHSFGGSWARFGLLMEALGPTLAHFGDPETPSGGFMVQKVSKMLPKCTPNDRILQKHVNFVVRTTLVTELVDTI